jgi:CRISPR type IV-associated protein Csf3
MVVPSTDKPLDAVLSWAAVRRADYEGQADPWSMQHNIGVRRHAVGQQWCFMAGNMLIEWDGPMDSIHYIRRARLEDHVQAWSQGLVSTRPPFDAQRGPTKAGSFVQPIRWVRQIRAFAVVDDMDRFKSLLPWVSHIGKLWHKDFGAVASFALEHDATATERWQQRNLPIGSECATAHVPAVGSLVAPYWKAENHGQVLAFAG